MRLELLRNYANLIFTLALSLLGLLLNDELNLCKKMYYFYEFPEPSITMYYYTINER